MRSLERHLLAWVLGALSFGALLLVLASYLVALDEMGEVFDNNLRQVALALAALGDDVEDIRQAPQSAAPPRIFEEQGEFDFTTAVWNRSGQLLSISDASRSLPFIDVSGLSRIGEGEDAWHIYTIVSGDRVVQAAQRGSARRVLAAEAVSKFLLPVLGLMLFVGGLLVFALRRGLRPLDSAAVDVAARSAASLDPIDTMGVPREIHPLIHSLNGLMQRLAEAFHVQRQFVADAAHELRSPVTALRLQLQLLERARDEKERKAALAELKFGIERAQRLIAQLLDLSRVEPDAPMNLQQPVDLSLLVHTAVVEHNTSAERKGIDLGAETPSPIIATADPVQLAVLLDNLVGNAIRYTPPGGRIDVKAHMEGAHPVIEVTDTGPGIAEAERERVFDRFYRGDAGLNDLSAPGSGLGLAIVDAIVKRHAAQVVLANRPPPGGLEVRVVFRAVSS